LRRFLWLLAAGLLLGQLAWADDKKDPPPKDSPPAKEPATPKEKFDALMKDYAKEQRELVPQIQKTKGAEQQKLLQKYFGLGTEFADKFYKIAEDNPKDPVAADALFWVLQNGFGSPAYAKAATKAAELVSEIPLKDLVRRLTQMRMMPGSDPKFFAAVMQRAEKEEKETQAADLLVWVATNDMMSPNGGKAAERLVDKYPDNPAIERLCQVLGNNQSPSAENTLKKILDKAKKDEIKAVAALNLGKVLAAKTDNLGEDPKEADKVAAEAEKYLVMVTDALGKDSPALKKQAEQELNVLRHLRVGKEAPDIAGPDLDDKKFKLSDYRGKVVLLDFWGNW
jgi:hypothetical protein